MNFILATAYPGLAGMLLFCLGASFFTGLIALMFIAANKRLIAAGGAVAGIGWAGLLWLLTWEVFGFKNCDLLIWGSAVVTIENIAVFVLCFVKNIE